MKHLEDFLCNCLYRADQCKEDNWQDLKCSIVWVAKRSIGLGKKSAQSGLRIMWRG